MKEMVDYKYGSDPEKDKEVDEAIDKYKRYCWQNPPCVLCDDQGPQVREDLEVGEYYCESCLTSTLKDDIKGLYNSGMFDD